jgi:hypothetical protein
MSFRRRPLSPGLMHSLRQKCNPENSFGACVYRLVITLMERDEIHLIEKKKYSRKKKKQSIPLQLLEFFLSLAHPMVCLNHRSMLPHMNLLDPDASPSNSQTLKEQGQSASELE